jgi:AcrR family transcriptional regulator
MRGRLSRSAIAEAALDAVRVKGIERLSLRQVAAALDVVPSALYGHIADRDDLYRAIAEAAYDRLARRMAEAAASEIDAVDRLRAIVQAYYRFACDDPIRFRVMTRFRPQLGHEWSEDRLEAGTQAFNVAADAVRAAVLAGRLRPVDPHMATLAILATARGTTTYTLDEDAPLDDATEELALAVLDIVIDGLALRDR